MRDRKDLFNLLSGFVLSSIIVLLKNHQGLFGRGILSSERWYVNAANAILADLPTSSVEGYYYSGVFAWLLTLPADMWHGLVFLRIANMAGINLCIALVYMIICRVTSRRWPGVLLLLYLTLVFRHSAGMYLCGNVSGMMFLPLTMALVTRSKIAKSILLSFACFPKPYGLGAVLSQKNILIWILPLTIVVIATMTSSASAGIAMRHIHELGNNSPAFGLNEIGIPWQISSIFFLVLAMTVGRGNVYYGICFGILALPMVWIHTGFILLIPICVAFEHVLKEEVGQKKVLKLLGLAFVVVVFYNFSFFGAENIPMIVGFVIAEIPTISVIILILLLPRKVEHKFI